MIMSKKGEGRSSHYDERDYNSGRGYDRDYNYDRRDYDYGYEHDGRNPYGSRGGYVGSDYERGHNNLGRSDINRRDRGMDYGYDYEYEGGRDGRRGVRGSGRGRDRHYEDMGMDRHYEDMRYLKPSQIHEWMEKIGAKWKKDQLKQYIEKENIDFQSKDYTEEEFVMTVNMLYSDYKDVLGSDPSVYIKLAKKFLEDKDAVVKGGEKLSSYYYAIAYDGNEEY